MPRTRVRKGWRKWVNTVNVSGVVIAVLTALPLYWLVTTALKPASEISRFFFDQLITKLSSKKSKIKNKIKK